MGAAFILISSSFSPFFLNASPKLLHIILSYDSLRLVRAAKGRKEIVMALGQVLECSRMPQKLRGVPLAKLLEGFCDCAEAPDA